MPPPPRARRYVTCDVFAARMGEGNPLAVVLDGAGLDDAAMLRIAREFNYSETTFVLPPEADGMVPVRIFTPGGELPFAGHPTVGTALVLAGLAAQRPQRLVLRVPRGPVPVALGTDDAGRPAATVTAPGLPEKLGEETDSEAVAAALGLRPEDPGPGPFETWAAGFPVLVVPLPDLATLARCRPAGPMPAGPARGLYPFVATGDAAMQARMFAPGEGIAEDPATGSAAVALAGWLAARDGLARGTHRRRIRQGVEIGRPGLIGLEFDMDAGGLAAVRIAGTAAMVMHGELTA